MGRLVHSSTFLFLFALLIAVATAFSMNEPIDLEEINDPDLKERVAQQLAAEGGESAEVDASKAPSGSLIAKEKRLPYPLCGVFILCERKGGFYGFPDARLFTAFGTSIYPRTVGPCQTRLVKGTSQGGSSYNHARIWPLLGEEFNEMCFYYERQHSCTSGTVTVVRNGATIYKCDRFYDAHTVQFCLSKFPYYCRYRNPAEIIFATTTSAQIAKA